MGGYISQNIYVGALYTNLPLFHILPDSTLFLGMAMDFMKFIGQGRFQCDEDPGLFGQ